MKINQFEIWLADLNPTIGTEPGKTRPVVIVQTNLLNEISHPSTIILPITINVNLEAELLRVHLNVNQLNQNSDVLIDQIRAIDNKRLIKKLGKLDSKQIKAVKENLKVVLDLE